MTVSEAANQPDFSTDARAERCEERVTCRRTTEKDIKIERQDQESGDAEGGREAGREAGPGRMSGDWCH